MDNLSGAPGAEGTVQQAAAAPPPTQEAAPLPHHGFSEAKISEAIQQIVNELRVRAAEDPDLDFDLDTIVVAGTNLQDVAAAFIYDELRPGVTLLDGAPTTAAGRVAHVTQAAAASKEARRRRKQQRRCDESKLS